jgi:hypothetical protein
MPFRTTRVSCLDGIKSILFVEGMGRSRINTFNVCITVYLVITFVDARVMVRRMSTCKFLDLVYRSGTNGLDGVVCPFVRSIN